MELEEYCTNPIHAKNKDPSEADLDNMAMKHSADAAPAVATLAPQKPQLQAQRASKWSQNLINAVVDANNAKSRVQGLYPKMKQGL